MSSNLLALRLPGRTEIALSFEQPIGRIWLRGLARVMEYATEFRRREVSISRVTPQLSVGGSFTADQIPDLTARGITAVVDCRSERSDDAALLAEAGVQLYRLHTRDKFAPEYATLRAAVDWVSDHLARGGHVYIHCEHGVGRAPLLASATLVAHGHSAGDALRMVRSARWQALPNDRQLHALRMFEVHIRHGGAEAA
ncbi:MAG: dual specificity protein phosphatase family protein [Chloroflexi bacterium]|nr:dual specificity protein phosphatase family protein [Chloroflexota bacterium]